MKNFINGVITARDIAEIKRAVRSESNNPKYQIAYQNVLADTQTAVDNIEECLVDVNALRKIYIGFSNGDISFLDAVLGLNPRGENDSHYRDYLTLDEGSIVGIRISGHPTTKKTLLDKANNNAQYLLQVVLVPQNPNPTAHDAITTDTKVGNLQVLTQVYVGADYNWDNLEDLLKKIADYLTCPEYSGAGGGRPQQQTTINQQQNCSMNRRTVTLTESRLCGIIREVISEAFKSKKLNALNKEHGGLDKRDWRNTKYVSHLSDDEIGDTIDQETMKSQYKKPGHLNPLHATKRGDYFLRFNDGSGVSLNPNFATRKLYAHHRDMEDNPGEYPQSHSWTNPIAAERFLDKKEKNTVMLDVGNTVVARPFKIGSHEFFFNCTKNQQAKLIYKLRKIKSLRKQYDFLTKELGPETHPFFD